MASNLGEKEITNRVHGKGKEAVSHRRKNRSTRDDGRNGGVQRSRMAREILQLLCSASTTRPTTHFYISNFETRKWKENEEYAGLRRTRLTSALALDDRRR